MLKAMLHTCARYRDYLHNNPVVVGFVEKPEDWLYSSAIDYYTKRRGMLDILLLDPIIVSY